VYNFCEPRWDGVAHLWFDDAAAAERAMATAAQSRMLTEDSAKFIGNSLRLFVTEHILIWPK
jgi:EthD domain